MKNKVISNWKAAKFLKNSKKFNNDKIYRCRLFIPYFLMYVNVPALMWNVVVQSSKLSSDFIFQEKYN